jgi:hypothetical protein
LLALAFAAAFAFALAFAFAFSFSSLPTACSLVYHHHPLCGGGRVGYKKLKPGMVSGSYYINIDF